VKELFLMSGKRSRMINISIRSQKVIVQSEGKFQEKKNKITSSEIIKFKNIDDGLKIGDKIEFIPLGQGKLISIDKQIANRKEKYNLIFKVQFDIGQSCVF